MKTFFIDSLMGKIELKFCTDDFELYLGVHCENEHGKTEKGYWSAATTGKKNGNYEFVATSRVSWRDAVIELFKLISENTIQQKLT